MAPLTAEQIRKENQDRDSSSITSLNLTLRALSDVSCLRNFPNLERLDLSCNNVSSLQGLCSCVNLKWLSVAQNKLESLSGIEGLLKLKVLNASKNMIKTMNEVRGLTNLGALILNDNKISSVCKLDTLMYLNTLVLSRNPIYDIGRSLENVKSITKLSLSSCQIQDIGNSLLFCVKLKEARFTHNEITTLPDQLAKNAMLRHLDLGQNAISKMSDLKVFSTLQNLRNLNLQGNPIAENYNKDKLEKKVKKLVPTLQTFNAKPMGKSHEGKEIYEKDTSFSGKEVGYTKGGKKDTDEGISFAGKETDHTKNLELEADKEAKRKRSKPDAKASKGNVSYIGHNDVAVPIEIVDDGTKKKLKTNEKVNEKIISSAVSDGSSPFDSVDIEAKEAKQRKTKKSVGNRFREFDDGTSSFMDLILNDDNSEDNLKKGLGSQTANDEYLLGGLVINPLKNKKKKKTQVISKGSSALELLPPPTNIGMGGPSAWDD